MGMLPFMFITLGLVGSADATAPTPIRSDFERAARGILSRWENPGTIVVIVKNAEVILAKGYGTTRTSGGALVTPTTLCSVASVTKTVTSIAIGMLVAEGKLGWDDPVKGIIPEFRFADRQRTEAATIRDLITHRAGLPAVMGGLSSSDYTMEHLLRDLPEAEPLTGFHGRIEYSQVGFALLGEVVWRTAGATYPEFVTERILKPLAMSSSFVGTRDLLAAYPEPDAVPNLMGRVLRVDHEYVAGPWQGPAEIYGPAGGLITTGEDMARYMNFVLAGGVVGGMVLVPAEIISEVQRPRGELFGPYRSVTSPFNDLVEAGMGWLIHDFEGHRIVEHGGSNFGSSVVALAPEAKVGVFVSTSATFSLDSDRLVSALKFAALAHALGLEQRDWVAAFNVAP